MLLCCMVSHQTKNAVFSRNYCLHRPQNRGILGLHAGVYPAVQQQQFDVLTRLPSIQEDSGASVLSCEISWRMSRRVKGTTPASCSWRHCEMLKPGADTAAGKPRDGTGSLFSVGR